MDMTWLQDYLYVQEHVLAMDTNTNLVVLCLYHSTLVKNLLM